MRTISLAAVAAALLLIPAASAPAKTSCGRLHGGFESHIVSYSLGCTVARKIVNDWHRKAVTNGQGPGNKIVGDFKCKSKATDPEHVNVTCTHKEFTNQRVTFFAGP
jgi:hypothetical protein